MSNPQASTIPVVVEFTGGLEMLFDDKKKHNLSIPAKDESDGPTTLASLVTYLCSNVMKDPREDMFVLDGHVRPGILVLINDADWELEGEEKYQVQPGDNILFVTESVKTFVEKVGNLRLLSKKSILRPQEDPEWFYKTKGKLVTGLKIEKIIANNQNRHPDTQIWSIFLQFTDNLTHNLKSIVECKHYDPKKAAGLENHGN